MPACFCVVDQWRTWSAIDRHTITRMHSNPAGVNTITRCGSRWRSRRRSTSRPAPTARRQAHCLRDKIALSRADALNVYDHLFASGPDGLGCCSLPPQILRARDSDPPRAPSGMAHPPTVRGRSRSPKDHQDQRCRVRRTPCATVRQDQALPIVTTYVSGWVRSRRRCCQEPHRPGHRLRVTALAGHDAPRRWVLDIDNSVAELARGTSPSAARVFAGARPARPAATNSA